MKTSTKFLSVISLFVLLGVAAMITGIWGPTITLSNIRTDIINIIVVDSPDSSKYENFVSNVPKRHPNPNDVIVHTYSKFYLFNITNSENVRKMGDKPNITQIGPYFYRKFFRKQDVHFSKDSQTVKYFNQNWYTFDPDKTGKARNPYKDKIVNLNPGYIGLVKHFGNEAKLSEYLISPTLSNSISIGQQFLVPFAMQQRLPSYLMDKKNAILMDSPGATENDFFACWANCTGPPPPSSKLTSNATLWENLLPSAHSKRSSWISMTAAQNLWNPAYPASFVNPNRNLTNLMYWTTIQVPLTASSPPLAHQSYAYALGNLSQSFFIPPPHLEYLVNHWFTPQLAPNFLLPTLKIEFPSIASLNQLMFYQWGVGNLILPWNPTATAPTATNKLSINQILPTYYDQVVPPEYSVYTERELFEPNTIIPLQKTLDILNSTTIGLLNPVNLGEFLHLAATLQWDAIDAKWSLTSTQSLQLAGYFTLYVDRHLTNQTILTFDNTNNGLFVSKTPDDWLWTSTDDLVEYTFPNKGYSKTPLFFNATSKSAASIYQGTSDTWQTGSEDLNTIHERTTFKGKTRLSSIWENPIKISGTDGTQFPPNLGGPDSDSHGSQIWNTEISQIPFFSSVFKTYVPDVQWKLSEPQKLPFDPSPNTDGYTPLQVWSDDTLRTLSFQHTSTQSRYGVSLWIHTLDNNQYEPSPQYLNPDYEGMFNMTESPFTMGVPNTPFWLCTPLFGNTGTTFNWSSKLSNFPPFEPGYNSHIMVEPISGTTLESNIQWQYNIHIPDNAFWFTFERNIGTPRGLFYPLATVSEFYTYPNSYFQMFYDKVYLSLDSTKTLRLIGLIGAPVSFLLAMTTYSLYRKYYSRPPLAQHDDPNATIENHPAFEYRYHYHPLYDDQYNDNPDDQTSEHPYDYNNPNSLTPIPQDIDASRGYNSLGDSMGHRSLTNPGMLGTPDIDNNHWTVSDDHDIDNESDEHH